MNAVEIEAAISELALQPFDTAEFPFAFLAAFGNKDTTTLKRLDPACGELYTKMTAAAAKARPATKATKGKKA